MLWTVDQIRCGANKKYETEFFNSERSVTVLISTLKKLGPTATVSKLCNLLKIEEIDAKRILRSAKKRAKGFKERAKEISRRKNK